MFFPVINTQKNIIGGENNTHPMKKGEKEQEEKNRPHR
jgi:hypothetical protein